MTWLAGARRPVAAMTLAAGLTLGTAVTACGSAAPVSHPAAPSAGASSLSLAGGGYSYYRSVMTGYPVKGTSMMGGGPGIEMMSPAGYRWMMGGTTAPGWMRGGDLPGSMMGGRPDPGKVMGILWANAPGPRVGRGDAVTLGSQVPAGARADRSGHQVVFTSAAVRLAVVTSPPGGPDETFRVAGMVNPTIVVPAGARVSIKVINADPGTAHGLVVTRSSATPSWMPMMTERPAFAGAALWFLGNPTRAGLHAGTLTFTAATPGTYRYLCAVPGHAQQGMTGSFVVRA
jgi:rusticyanin